MSTPEEQARIATQQKIKDDLENGRKDLSLKDELVAEAQQVLTQERLQNQQYEEGRDRKKAQEYWQKVGDDVASFTKPSAQHANVEWSTLVMEMVAALDDLVKAGVYGNLSGQFFGFIWKSTIGRTKFGPQVEGALSYGVEKALQKIDFRPTPKAAELRYEFELDAAGKFTSTVMKNSELLPEDQKQKFDAIFFTWAIKRGCQVDFAAQTIKDPDGNPMTLEALEALNADDYNGFNAYIKNNCELTASTAPRMGA